MNQQEKLGQLLELIKELKESGLDIISMISNNNIFKDNIVNDNNKEKNNIIKDKPKVDKNKPVDKPSPKLLEEAKTAEVNLDDIKDMFTHTPRNQVEQYAKDIAKLVGCPGMLNGIRARLSYMFNLDVIKQTIKQIKSYLAAGNIIKYGFSFFIKTFLKTFVYIKENKGVSQENTPDNTPKDTTESEPLFKPVELKSIWSQIQKKAIQQKKITVMMDLGLTIPIPKEEGDIIYIKSNKHNDWLAKTVKELGYQLVLE